jgi:hypothetical protein
MKVLAVTSRMVRPRVLAWAFGLLLACGLAASGDAQAPPAGPRGKVQGKIVATDTGDPIGFADVSLVPDDTTMKRIGGLTNADGTFLLEAAAGRYTLQVRALSYARKRIEGIVIVAGQLLPFSTALAPEAIPQEEIVVEAKARLNTETSMLQARKKAAAVGDAVSAEQVRRSPDKDAAEVLRRVTGLSVSDGKYVFVRGLGERYSSTEVDGVRIASPEMNKRVVPLDLLPANLLENIVVQKTYTADRPGEFGGGDVQVHTKDFPGRRTWSLSVSQSKLEGVSFEDRLTYKSSNADLFGFGAGSRGIPADVANLPVPSFKPANYRALANLASSFSDVWSTRRERTIPNGSYSATYGDEFKLFGHPLGLIESWSFARGFDHEHESQRSFATEFDTLYDYKVQRWTESANLGGITGLSYRLSPSHTVHVRGLYTNSADDEVRTYEGPDHNRIESTTGLPLEHRSTRFTYVQRNVLSGTIEGQHDFKKLFGANLDWKFSRSKARRQQPDRRELTYDKRYYYDGDTAHWVLGSTGRREFGDLKDNGWGTTIVGSLPYHLGRLGNGKGTFGYDRQTKERGNFYRRFNIYPNANVDREAPPDSIFSPTGFDGSPDTGWLEDVTANDPLIGLDNYRAHQFVEAGYLTLDVPLGKSARGNFGMRRERGTMDVQSFALFQPGKILARGRFANVDWLPSANLTWSATNLVNVRFGASRTVSRPDLNEMSPSPVLEYVGGMLHKGNPDLKRATIENYDLRVEGFPTMSEVFAAGVFFKKMDQPVEQVIHNATPQILAPENSDHGRNLGLELEVRSSLGRLAHRLDRFAVNANASWISSKVNLKQVTTKVGQGSHPLQGQAAYLVNAALSWSTSNGRADLSVLLGATGRRLTALGATTVTNPIPDIYESPSTSLDATMNLTPLRNLRMKFAGKNLLDPNIRQMQGRNEVSSFHRGRGYSIAVSYGQ